MTTTADDPIGVYATEVERVANETLRRRRQCDGIGCSVYHPGMSCMEWMRSL